MRHRLFEEVAAQPELLPLAEAGLLALALIDYPVLPFAFAVGPEWRVPGMIRTRQPAVHADDIRLRHVELGRVLFQILGREVAFLHRLQLTLQLAQIEEEILLRAVDEY